MTAPPLVLVVGPTAAGKSELGLRLAESLDGEIVSADSRQVYRGMDIGTAKATAAERTLVPHHLIDVVDPDHWLTLADWLELAAAAIAGIRQRGHLPLVVGGTGQYVNALVEGWSVPAVAPQVELRGELAKLALDQGPAVLHGRLAELDPTAASRIDSRNVRRVIRALEVCLVTGKPVSELQSRNPPPDRVLRIGVRRARPVLYERIDRRIDRMLEAGLVAEVERLAAAGYGWDLPAMTGLGYRQIGQVLRGEIALPEAILLIRRGSRRFVHQQDTWFRPSDAGIRWVDPAELPPDRVTALVMEWLASGQIEDLRSPAASLPTP